MEYWEFLLQKEGDRSWLPLESPDVEILEGRYRVVARSSRANTSVEIRITHQVADEVPPKRRAQKRFGRTNKDGLMVVFPFTRMKPGLWEIRCAGDLMSDFLGQSWQHMVCLQVLPQEFESETDWDPEWEMQEETASEVAAEPNSTPTEPEKFEGPIYQTEAEVEGSPSAEPEAPSRAAEVTSAAQPTVPAAEATLEPGSAALSLSETANYSVEQLQYIAERISEAEASLLPDVASANPVNAAPSSWENSETAAIAEAASSTPELIATPDAAVEPSVPENLPLQLVLAQSAYMTSWGRPFTLSGRLELGQESRSTAIANLPASASSGEGELQVCLSDPQSAQVLVEVRQPIASQQLPYVFDCTLEIPLSCKTRLLLGEVAFYRSTAPTGSPDAATLSTADAAAIQSFTLTADVDELLDAIAADLSEEQLLDLPLPTAPESEAEPEPEPEEVDETVDAPESDRAYLN
ncbi:MAG TPA: hypothetical protein V6D04_07225, partial [Candidatus Obscuribacterales bacterium]